MTSISIQPILLSSALLLPIPIALSMAASQEMPPQTIPDTGTVFLAPDACLRAAQLAQRAAILDATEEYTIALAGCVNISDPGDRAQCYEDARQERDEALELVQDQFEARMALCGLLGSAPYDPPIDPEDFSSVITNPFFPQVAGLTLVYEADDEGEIERIEVSLQTGTRNILGVDCAIVRDTATIDGVLLEDTLDYYAQDSLGNVWYFGETAINFDDEGNLEDIDGSWLGGVEFAKPGIVMQATPIIGQVYRQEYELAEAEDIAAVIGLDESVSVAFGRFDGCLQTQDTTPLEPEVLEEKYYAPGVGLVLAVDTTTGVREELIDIF